MNADWRREQAAAGRLTLGQCLAWAARASHEVPLINGEYFFIAEHTPEALDA